MEVIRINKWSQDERVKWCERLITHSFKTADALGFEVVTDNSTGKRLIGLKVRRQGFDLPTVITEGQLLKAEATELLKQLGVK